MVNWNIITGEYPPQRGGVSDYTRLIANGLAESGDTVYVWAPECLGENPEDLGITINRLSGHFGSRALEQLDSGLNRQSGCSQLLIQYVPHMYGWRAMNCLFSHWVWRRRHLRPWIMFHEVCSPIAWDLSLKHNILGAVNHLMAGMLVRGASEIYVSIPAWERILRQVGLKKRAKWLPIPSTMPLECNPDLVDQTRSRYEIDSGKSIIGHFGSFGSMITKLLVDIIPPLLDSNANLHGLLIGRNSLGFVKSLIGEFPQLKNRIHGAENLPPKQVAAHLKLCDLLLQPYPDGVSSRRTSMMAGLALGIPIITTKGVLTEDIWDEGFVALAPDLTGMSMVEAASSLLNNPSNRNSIGEKGKKYYQDFFHVNKTIETLRREVNTFS